MARPTWRYLMRLSSNMTAILSALVRVTILRLDEQSSFTADLVTLLSYRTLDYSSAIPILQETCSTQPEVKSFAEYRRLRKACLLAIQVPVHIHASIRRV